MSKAPNTEKQKEAVEENKKSKIKAIVAKMKRPRNLILLGVGVALLLGLIIAAVYYISMGSDPDDYTMLGSSSVTSSQSSTVDSSIADSSMMSSEIMSSAVSYTHLDEAAKLMQLVKLLPIIRQQGLF